MGEFFDIQQVCLNGHQINSSFQRNPKKNKDFCDECGAETIHLCPNCNHPIMGYHHVDNVMSFTGTPVPKNCEKCGHSFPWTVKKNVQKVKKEKKEVSNDKYSNLVMIENLCFKFHSVVRQIKDRYNDRYTLIIKDEYDVQDLFHALLRIYFDDIRPEDYVQSYAGGSSRVDFVLPEEKIVIEIKKTRKSLKDKKLGEELLIDIARYQKHPDCNTLICFVYDPDGFIKNPKGLENDLNKNHGKITVKTIIVPKL